MCLLPFLDHIGTCHSKKTYHACLLMTVTYPTPLLDYNGTCHQNLPHPTFPPTLPISIFSLHNVNFKIMQIGIVLDDPTRYRCHVGKLNFLKHTRIIYILDIKSI